MHSPSGPATAVQGEKELCSQVAEALTLILSTDNVARRAAETQLGVLHRMPGFIDALLDYVLPNAATSAPPATPLRTVAVTVLKQLIVEGESDELCTYVAQRLLDILADESDVLHGTTPLLRQCAATLCAAVVSLARSGTDAVHNTGTSVPHSWASFVHLLTERVLDVLHGSSVAAQHAYALVLCELCETLPRKSFLRAKMLDTLPPLFQLAVTGVDMTCSSATSTSQLQLQHVVIGAIHQMYLWAITTRGRHSDTAKVLGALWQKHFAVLYLYWLEPCATFMLRTEANVLSEAELCRWRLARAVASLSCTLEVLAVTRWRTHFVDAGLLQAVLHTLHSDAVALHHALTHEDDDTSNDDVTVAWQLFRQLSCGRWCVLRDALGEDSTRRSFEEFMLQSIETTASYVRLVVAYAQLPQSESEAWADDASAFLRAEEALEDDVGQSMRETAVSCLSQSMHLLPVSFARAAVGQLLACLHEAAADAGGDAWRMREAVWLAWQRVVDGGTTDATTMTEVVPIDTLLDEALTTDLRGPTMLTIRALAFVSTVLRHTRRGRPAVLDVTATVDTLIPVALASLQTPHLPHDLSSSVAGASRSADFYLICAATCKLLWLLQAWCDAPRLRRYFPPLQDALYSTLLPDSHVEDDLLYLVLDTLTAWTRRARRAAANEGGAAEYEVLPSAATLLLCAWRLRVQDPNLGEAVASLFRELVPCARCEDGVKGELPWLLSVVSGTCSLPVLCTAPTVLQILTDIFRYGSAALADATVTMILSAVCNLLLATTESAVMVAAASCLTAALRRCRDASAVPVRVLPSLLQQTDGISSGSDGNIEFATGGSLQRAAFSPQGTEAVAVCVPFTKVLVAVAYRILDARQPEARLMDVGDGLEAMMESAGQFTDEEVRQLLHVMLTRLSVAKTATVREQLFMPLAVLLKHYREPFLLALLQGGWLSAVFQPWLHDLAHFSRVRNVCKACESLADLLTYWPASVLDGTTLTVEARPAHHTKTSKTKHSSRQGYAAASETMLLEHAIAIALVRAAQRLLRCSATEDESEVLNSISSTSQCASDAEEDSYETLSGESDADLESTQEVACPDEAASTHQTRPAYVCATLCYLQPVFTRYHTVLAARLPSAELHDVARQLTSA